MCFHKIVLLKRQKLIVSIGNPGRNLESQIFLLRVSHSVALPPLPPLPPLLQFSVYFFFPVSALEYLWINLRLYEYSLKIICPDNF